MFPIISRLKNKPPLRERKLYGQRVMRVHVGSAGWFNPVTHAQWLKYGRTVSKQSVLS